MTEKQSIKSNYIIPAVDIYNIDYQGILCSSPENPGYGGNEDMEQGDDL